MDESSADKVVKDITSNFVVRGNHHVHGWYAYAIIGVVFGMSLMVVYVANRNGQFDASQAAKTVRNERAANLVAGKMLPYENKITLENEVEGAGMPSTDIVAKTPSEFISRFVSQGGVFKSAEVQIATISAGKGTLILGTAEVISTIEALNTRVSALMKGDKPFEVTINDTDAMMFRPAGLNSVFNTYFQALPASSSSLSSVTSGIACRCRQDYKIVVACPGKKDSIYKVRVDQKSHSCDLNLTHNGQKPMCAYACLVGAGAVVNPATGNVMPGSANDSPSAQAFAEARAKNPGCTVDTATVYSRKGNQTCNQ